MNELHQLRLVVKATLASEELKNEIVMDLIKTKLLHDCIYFGGEDSIIVYFKKLSQSNIDYIISEFEDSKFVKLEFGVNNDYVKIVIDKTVDVSNGQVKN